MLLGISFSGPLRGKKNIAEIWYGVCDRKGGAWWESLGARRPEVAPDQPPDVPHENEPCIYISMNDNGTRNIRWITSLACEASRKMPKPLLDGFGALARSKNHRPQSGLSIK